MRGIIVEIWRIRGESEGYQGENILIGVEMWREIKIKRNMHVYKNLVLTFWYGKQRN